MREGIWSASWNTGHSKKGLKLYAEEQYSLRTGKGNNIVISEFKSQF